MNNSVLSELELLLDDIVAFINQLKEEEQSPKIREIGLNIAHRYFALQKEKTDILDYFDKIFVKDTELYILVLSVLFFLFKEAKFLDKSESLIHTDTVSYDFLVGIRQQIGSIRFNDPRLPRDYPSQRECHRYMTKRLKEELGVTLSKIPYKERNHNRIIVSTDTLLADTHAPTHLVLEVAECLQKQGYEVQVLVGIEKADTEKIESYWLYPYHFHYLPGQNGEFERQWKKEKIKGYQQVVDKEHYDEVRDTLKKVAEWKPECIWHIGGQSAFADLLGEISTLAFMGCVSGEVISDAPVFVRYFQNTSPIVEEMKKYASEMKQRFIKIQLGSSFNLEGNIYTRQEFGIPEDAFVIALVGNRLDTELDTRFVRIMEQMVESENQIYFILIGDTKREWNKGILKGHVHPLGYQKSLADILKLADIFLNPPRQGGAGGAVCAIAAGVPVITLPDCDVADRVKETFFCKKLEDMLGQVIKYIKDKEYYENQVRICKEMQKEFMDTYENVSKEYKKVILQITDWLKEGEIV